MPRPSYWLFKCEPEVFSFDDLLASRGKRTLWDGVRNYQARNFLRDDVKKGDGVFFYHSNAKPPGVAGVCEVVKEGYPDPTQFDPKDSHFDAGSAPDDPRWYAVDVKAVEPLPSFVPIQDLKSNPKLAKMALVQRGQRLSIQRVSAAEWREVRRMGGLKVRQA